MAMTFRWNLSPPIIRDRIIYCLRLRKIAESKDGPMPTTITILAIANADSTILPEVALIFQCP